MPSSIQQVFMNTYPVPSSVPGSGYAAVSLQAKPCPHELRTERQELRGADTGLKTSLQTGVEHGYHGHVGIC